MEIELDGKKGRERKSRKEGGSEGEWEGVGGRERATGRQRE